MKNLYIKDITEEHALTNLTHITTIQYLINKLKLVPKQHEFITNYFQEIKTEMYWKTK
jgi:hypothetical protein